MSIVGYFCDDMAGEISPDITFCEIGKKMVCVNARGCRSIWMGAIGSMIMGRNKNKEKTNVIG